MTTAEAPIASGIDFHPAVAAWFRGRFEAPTDAQTVGWPRIASGRDTLISAPTGSGKTLAAFLAGIDGLVRKAEAGTLEAVTEIVYVTPLKALGNDIQRNLETPLEEIREVASDLGLEPPPIRTAVRSGDTTQSERQAMVRKPPHILITTPESLYLMITAERSRENLRRVRTVIVDEIHALARDRRGSHLALTLARLDQLVAESGGERPARIGLSATQRPIEEIARFLVGADCLDADGEPDCAIVDLGHQRDLDLAVELPPSDLEAIAPAEQWGEIYERIAELIAEHRTTLVFVNTRRLSERVRAQARRARRRGARREPPRQPLQGAAAAAGAAAQGRRAARAGGDRLARARHRHRLDRPRLPDRIAAQHRHLSTAHWPLRSCPGPAVRMGGMFPTTRDELIESRGAPRAAVRAGRLDKHRASPSRAARRAGAAARGRMRLRATGPRTALFDLMRTCRSRTAQLARTRLRRDACRCSPAALARAPAAPRPLLHHDRDGTASYEADGARASRMVAIHERRDNSRDGRLPAWWRSLTTRWWAR